MNDNSKKIRNMNTVIQKSIKTTIIMLFLVFMGLTKVYAQPANDICANAIVLTPTTGTCNSSTYTNFGATTTAGDPVPACWSPATISNNVWFKFVASSTSVEISTNFSGMTLANTQIAVYSGACGALTQIACQEDISPTLLTNDIIINGLTLGNTYYIMIDGNGNSTGTFGICVQNIPAPGPPSAEQDCSTAIYLCNGNAKVVAGGAYNTGTIVESPSCFGAPGERASHWYSFTAANNGNLAFTISPATVVDYDFAVFDITNGCLGTQIACNWTACTGAPTNDGKTGLGCANTASCGFFGGTRSCDPAVPVTAGRTYAILVDRYTASASSGFTLDFTGSTMGFAGPTANFSATTVCAGKSTVFTDLSIGTGSILYSWSFGDGSTSTSQNPTHLYATAGTYTVTLIITTNPGGCQNVITKTITVTAGPTVSISPASATICSVGSVSLTGTATTVNAIASYLWTPSTNLTSTTTTATIANPPSTTTYTLKATDNLGCIGTAPVTITVSNITASITSSTNVTCNGGSNGSATAAGASGSGTYTYAWQGGGTSPTKSGLVAGTYVVTVTDASGGCTATASVTITQPAAVTATITATTNVGCNGASTGSATIAGGGGNGTYTYAWQGGGTSPTKSGLAAGSYTVTVTDGNLCTATTIATITQPAVVTATITATTNVGCNGASTGSATVAGGGGNGTYTYAWQGGGTSTTKSGLAAGSYTVTVTDGNLCTATTTAIITQPSVLIIVTGSSNPACSGATGGTASATPSGGTAPYSYLWNTIPVQTTASATSLLAGTYTVTITDANSCTQTASVIITQPLSMSVTINKIDAACNGSASGSATAVTANGTSPFTYNWNSSPVQTTATASNLPAGAYSVTVTDNNLCTATATVTITEPAALTATITATVNASCNGANNGSLTSAGNGGIAPYTYAWQGGGTNPTKSGLAAGSYVVTITDSKLCTATTTGIVTEPALIVLSTTTTPVACGGAATGSATVNTLGGVAPYVYIWNTIPSQTTATAINLPAGTYTVTVTDNNLCSNTTSVTVTEPIAMSVLTAPTDVNCNGDNTGSATVIVSDGTAPYTYKWSTIPVQTTNSATGLPAGTYTVTVTDAHLCTITASVTIAQPTVFTLNLTSTNALCNGANNGSATANAGGGTMPYVYNWNTAPVQNTAIASNLGAGNYKVTVTDANGCSNTATVTITQPLLFTSSATGTNENCNHSDGTATAAGLGGTLPYTYAWNTIPVQTTAIATNISGGTYIVTITDAKGCTTTSSTTINNTGSPTASVLLEVDASTNGSSDGSATILAVGGVPSYTYKWSTVPTQILPTATGLAAGSYSVTVTGMNGCSTVITVVINEPALLTAITSQTNVACSGGNTGTASVIASGGVAPYTYLWNTIPAQITPTAIGLGAGLYTVKITDIKGATVSKNFNIVEASPIIVAVSATNITCSGGTNGSVTASPSGGTAPYSYVWNTIPAKTTAVVTNITAGTYNVTVTDVNGCTQTATTTVTESSPIVLTTSSTDENCNSGVGTTTVNATGGTGTYIYKWNTSPIQTTATATGLSGGNYTVTVTDANSCTQMASVIVNNVGGPSATITSSTNVTVNGGSDGAATVSASDGVSPYTYAWNSIPVQNSTTASNLPAGTYTVTVTGSNGCKITASVVITEPTAMVLTTVSTNVACNGGSNGTATVTPVGGTAPYTYAWNTIPVQTTATALGLTVGAYSVTVTDANGGTASVFVNILQSNAIVGSVLATDVSCFGGNNGTVTAIQSGGTSPYSYLWNTVPVQNTITATNLSVGAYIVTITDANACTATASGTINQPADIVLSTSNTNENCNSHNGTVTANIVSGGIAPFSYSWNTAPVQNTATAINIGSGAYTVSLTDSKGCSKTGTATVSNIGAPTASITSSTNVTVNGNSDGTATVSESGGTLPYSYLWNSIPPQTTSTAINLPAGTYTVTVTGADGCNATTSVVITEPQAFIIDTARVNVSCFGGSNGSASVIPSGGTAPYSYAWNTIPVQTTSTAVNLTAGTYKVIVTDANGGKANKMVHVVQPNAITVVLSSKVDVLCNGNNTGSATVSVSGGSPIYSYAWQGGGTAPTKSNLIAGIYNITITDSKVCKKVVPISISQPSALVASISSFTNVSCNGGANGSATATVSGGKAPYTYAWSAGGATATKTPLAAGVYTVTITDANICTITTTATITEPTAIAPSVSVVSNVSCNGGNNGSATASATGGTGVFTYLWQSGNTAATENNLVANTYTVTLTDAKACTAKTTVTINEPTALIATISSFTNANCNGGNTGAATVAANGGVAPYSYAWSSGGVSATESNLIAGTYIATVTDANACSANISVIIAEPTALTASISSITNVACNGGNTGSATVLAVGGTVTYSYAWSSGGTAATENNLAAGTYIVTITDAKLCSVIVTATVLQNAPITAAISSSSNVLCNGGNTGTATVVGGGSGAYTYLWSSGGNAATENNLAVGTYTVTVTDASLCTATTSVIITEPMALSFIPSHVDVLCNGSNTGSATVIVNGGTGAYTYQWSSGGNAATENNLAAGTYTVTIKDANLCSTNTSITIAQPLALVSVPTASSDTVCINGTAILNANIINGTAQYTYTWSSSIGAVPASVANPTVNPAITTAYTVTITDVNLCSVVSSLVVNVRNALSVKINPVSKGVCDKQSITLSAAGKGGDGNYKYQWTAKGFNSPYSNSNSVTVTPTDTMYYTVTLMDGCSTPIATDSVQVIWYPIPVVTIRPLSSLVGCDPLIVSLKAVSSFVSTYKWDLGNGLIVNTPTDSLGHEFFFKNAANGMFIVNLSITSVNGCIGIATPVDIKVNEHPIAEFSYSPTIISVLDPTVNFSDQSSPGNSGSIVKWTWDFNTGDSSSTQNPAYTFKDVNSYPVKLTVVNSEGCKSPITNFVAVTEDYAFYIPDAFTPNGDGNNDTFGAKGVGISEFEMSIFSRWGGLLYHTNDINKPWDGSAYEGGEAPMDVYVYKIVVTDFKKKQHEYTGRITLLK
jgi:gliding motility-associated-like protein